MSESGGGKPNWTLCNFCDRAEFQSMDKFVRHLRDQHCTQEGGSYVCRYGDNGVCWTLPVEGVSDSDYEKHVLRHHVTGGLPGSRKLSTSSTGSDRVPFANHKWALNSTAQNLPAVLNDPTKAKRKDFFTKLWGEGFVEVTDVPDPPYLPRVSHANFDYYLKKIAKRHRKHMRLMHTVPKSNSHSDLLKTFPSLRLSRYSERIQFDLSPIPKIFLKPNLDLSNYDIFNAVYSQASGKNNSHKVVGDNPTTVASSSTKLLQEKLTHYLDLVEVLIAQQVAQKSDAFFHAMASHDTLMEQLDQTISTVKSLRNKISKIEKDVVNNSLLVLKSERSRCNRQLVYDKLKIMATVMHTQSTIQLLLSNRDYVGALDLIQATEILLVQELTGVHSFRHLGSELTEMLKVIDTLMTEEFERYCTADLNRPLMDPQPEILEEEKLICIVLGLLKRGNFEFVEIYKKEVISAVKAAVKQAAIEVVVSSEAHGDLGLEEQLKMLKVDEWFRLHTNTSHVLLKLCQRVKKSYDLMISATNISAGHMASAKEMEGLILSESSDGFLSSSDHEKVVNKLHDVLVYICKYSQERCAQLLSSRTLIWNEEKCKDDNSRTNNHWWMERATLKQLKDLAKLVGEMNSSWDALCPTASIHSYKSAFSHQANRFMYKFHVERTTKLHLILDGEPWKRTDVPNSFQQLVNSIANNGRFAVPKDGLKLPNGNAHIEVEKTLHVGSETFAVVGTVLMLVNMVAEYCFHAEEIPVCAEALLRYVSDLLVQFNSKCYKLILGGEALSEKTGLQKITSTNMALLLRALHLVLWLIPHVRVHFQGLIGESFKDQLEEVTIHIKNHAVGIMNKLTGIMKNLISSELRNWDAKPPVPSKPFQNICGHLKRLSEAVTNILPHDQVQELYKEVNISFKELFSDKLHKMNLTNDGGVTHGLVSTELIFYLEGLRRVDALPAASLELSAMNDIWTMRSS
ncbi:Vacuolar protein [Nesidiocoris tenuis]|uniref:Vacuolar protein sorting-associated protein 54 n=1 Tax=Nesidiocoris tenuis TaxID=355587 RepID=A0ABN7ARV3_9HEMI|nr:Vacuolar protein [Nesidiocoris tenuis]